METTGLQQRDEKSRAVTLWLMSMQLRYVAGTMATCTGHGLAPGVGMLREPAGLEVDELGVQSHW